MYRFYLPPAGLAPGLLSLPANGPGKLEVCSALRLTGREAHHALHVLRLKRDDPVTVLDGAGHEFSCEVEKCSRDAVGLRVTKKHSVPPPPCEITLLQALPKGKIIEGIIQKAVELRAHRIVPLLTGRVVPRLDDASAESKRAKWQQVAIEAIKQCGAAWLPKIEAPTTLVDVLTRYRSGRRQIAGIARENGGSPPKDAGLFELSLVGSLRPGRRHPREVFREFEKANGRLPESAAVWIGPEGDFTVAELQAIEANGALPISLGRLVLRVETAAVYCLSILNYELDR